MGSPNTADVEMVKALLDKWATPHVALQKVAEASDGRLVLTGAEWKVAEAIKWWYATPDTVRKYLKAYKWNMDEFATNFLKANAPKWDPESIATAQKLMNAAGVKVVNPIKVMVSAFWPDKVAENIVTSYVPKVKSWTSEEKDTAKTKLVAWLKATYGKDVLVDKVSTLLDKAWLWYFARRWILKSLKQ